MLESLLVITFSVGIITFLISLFEEWQTLLSMIMSFVSILFLLYTWASSVYIQVPTDTTTYSEVGFGWLCFGIILINVIGAIISVMNVTVYARRPRY